MNMQSDSVAGLSRQEIERRLSEWPITGIGLHPGGSNYVFVVRLADDDDEVYGIYKPAAGERPLRDFPYGTLHNRELSAYVVADELGWPAVPPTVVREGPHGVGSVQLFIDADFTKHYFNLREERLDDYMPIAMFDVLVNNADRKGGACLLDADGQLWAVDHGLTFNPLARRRTVMFEFNGTPYSDELLQSLDGFVSNLDDTEADLRKMLADTLDDHEIESLLRRGKEMLDDRSFPVLDPDWNVPWPMI
ncbi:MAG: hypothetical protein OXC83_08575 [Chloroflexi bacterium]|nr:hypothetical protein [Chloroflexota bacterium]